MTRLVGFFLQSKCFEWRPFELATPRTLRQCSEDPCQTQLSSPRPRLEMKLLRFYRFIPFVDLKTKQVKLVCHLHQPAFVTCWPLHLPHLALELMLSLMECSKLSLKGYFQTDKMFCLSPRTPLHFLCVTISQTGTSCSIPCSLNLKHSNTKFSFEHD